MLRGEHLDLDASVELWSTFVRPFGPDDLDRSWRVIFLGPPFAVCAAAGLVWWCRHEWRPYQVGLAASIAMMVVPEWALANLVTARWLFGAGVNAFGLILAALTLDALARRRYLVPLGAAIVVAQLAWQAAAFYPVWRSVAMVAMGYPETRDRPRRVARDSPIVDTLRELTASAPGRVMYSAAVETDIRGLALVDAGLASNALVMHGVPTLNGVAHGIVLDALYPTDSLTGGPLRVPASAHADQAFLDTLNVRYVVMHEAERGAPGLRERRRFDDGLRLFENPQAWGEAFAVKAFPAAPVPRRHDCENDRFFCADFGRDGVERETAKVGMERHRDGMTLHVPVSDRPQRVIVTQWYQDAWRVTSGRATLERALEQMIGVTVAAGESTVTIGYFPRFRGALFILSWVVEGAVAIACAVLAVRRRSAGGA